MNRALLAFATLLATLPRAEPCGPFLPQRLFEQPDEIVLETPLTTFVSALQKIPAPLQVDVRAAPAPDGDYYRQTSAADAADLRAALLAGGASEAEAESASAQLAEWRAKCEPRVERVDALWPQHAVALREAAGVRLGNVEPPAGLPPEFDLYLRGALAYYRGDFDAARAQWRAVLALPPEERRYRSTWAEYMIGKTFLDDAPTEAIPHFQNVRALAGEGFADTLGLAASSLGWEAFAEERLGHRHRAIELWLAQAQTGSEAGAESLLRLDFPWRDETQLREVAADPLLRRVVTASLVSGYPVHTVFRAAPGDNALLRERASRWLEAVESVGNAPIAEAELLAWAAYKFGEMDAAARWLRHAEDESAMANWLRAKLLVRDGKTAEAARLMSRVVRQFPPAEIGYIFNPDKHGWEFPRIPLLNSRNQPYADLALLRLATSDYAMALDALLRAGFWTDAAYLAERVMTVSELERYVDRHWPRPGPPPAARGNAPEFAATLGFPEERGRGIRWLLARRMTRLHLFAGARPYFPEEFREPFDRFVAAYRRGHNTSVPRKKRASALVAAAILARRQGIELMGYEIEPDWHTLAGDYTMPPVSKFRLGLSPREIYPGQDEVYPYDLLPTGQGILPPSADEQRRLAHQQPSPDRRWHYRWVASGLAAEAARLLPHQTEEKARALCLAGSWLKRSHPEEADVYYQELVRTCGQTALGREAERLRWFPPVRE